MHTALGLQIPEGIVPLELHRDRLYAGILPFQFISDRHLVAVTLSPAHIHTHQHRGPVIGLRSSCTGIDGQDSSEIVSLLSEHVPQFQILYLFLHRPVGPVQLLCLICLDSLCRTLHAFPGEIIQDFKISHSGSDLVISGHPEFHSRKLFQELLRLFGVIPEIRGESPFCLFPNRCPLCAYIQTSVQCLHPLFQGTYLLYSYHKYPLFSFCTASGRFHASCNDREGRQHNLAKLAIISVNLNLKSKKPFLSG